MLRTVLLATLVATVAAPVALAAEYRIVPEESGFAVVTHKGGIAAGFAHNHIIVARDYESTIEFDPDRPEATGFEFAVKAEHLTFDDLDEQTRWYPLIEEFGVLDEPFEDIGEKSRAEIRETALGPKQLDAETHPRLTASIVTVEPSGDEALPWRVTLAFEAHGTRVERPVAARYELGADGRVTIEATGPFRFTDFGFRPYRAMLGTVKNLDEFDVVVRAVAVPVVPDAAGETR